MIVVRCSVALLLAAWLTIEPGLAASGKSDDGAPAPGSLTVTTDPDGASVFVDGRPAGATPLRMPSVTAGEHRVRVVKDGYLENARMVTVAAGQPASVKVTMTRTSASAGAPEIEQVTSGGGGGGGSKKWLWIGLAGGGAAAAAVVLSGKNSPPSAGTITVSPVATGMAGFTSFTFTSDAADPDKDSLTYSWNFGDNGTASGSSASHTYATAGTYTVSLTVKDEKNSVSPANVTVVVGPSMTGTWIGGNVLMPDQNGNATLNCGVTLSLTQNNTAVTGTLTWTGNCQGSVALASSSAVSRTLHPASVSLTTSTINNWIVGTGSFSNLLLNFAGTTDASTGATLPGTFTLTQTTSTFRNTNTTTFRRQ